MDVTPVPPSSPHCTPRTATQSFTKLVDRVGDPPAPAPDPPAAMPPPAEDMPSAAPAATGVPTWQEVGFKEPPLTVFKVGVQWSTRTCLPAWRGMGWGVCSWGLPAAVGQVHGVRCYEQRSAQCAAVAACVAPQSSMLAVGLDGLRCKRDAAELS